MRVRGERSKEGRKTLMEGVRKDETRKEVMIVSIYYLQSDCIKMSFHESSNHTSPAQRQISCPRVLGVFSSPVCARSAIVTPAVLSLLL